MKPKPKSKVGSSRNKQSRESKAQIPLKEMVLKSACEDEIIWKLYNKCRKTKKGGDVKIYLQNVDFPIDVKYKRNFLSELKRKRVIKNFELKVKVEKLPPEIIEEISEPDLEILPFISLEDLKNALKDYKTINHFEMDYMAFIECDPSRVKKHLKEDYKRITRKIEIENLFKKEEVKKCGGLKFGLDSGNALYGGIPTNFLPDGDKYRLLKALIDNENQVLSYSDINGFLNQGKPVAKTKDRREISLIIRDIKRKLGILGKEPKNEDLFRARKGYAIVCDMDI